MKQHLRLQGLFGHLCASSGLYSKETFLTLYGCITRLVRDHHLKGFVLTCTLNDADFDTMAHALEDIPDLPLHRIPADAGYADNHQVGYLLMLTDRLCAGLFWSAAPQDAFRMFDGGWTFHPGDTRTMVTQLLARLAENGVSVEEPERLLRETGVDRRYDDKLNLLTTSLVRGLENRNRDLAIALEQVQLLNKRNVDTERLAAIGQLSSALAHEIRNPLGLIDLYAKLTEGKITKLSEKIGESFADDIDPLLKNLALIRQATSSLESILSELTEYSRPLRLSLQMISLSGLVHEVCDFYHASYTERGISLTVSAKQTETGDTILIDSGKIRQALINLLKNALEASQPGQRVTVNVSRHPVNEFLKDNLREPSPIYVTVTDEGLGVSPANVGKLFTPYFSTKGSDGTGLGLAHSRKILQAHGGSVELLHSNPGEGSTFALILPSRGAAAEDFVQMSESQPAPTNSPIEEILMATQTPRARSTGKPGSQKNIKNAAVSLAKSHSQEGK